MKFLNDILPAFYETKKFPEEFCDVQNKTDDNVLDSKQKFECVIFNKSWNSCEIKELFPYIWINDFSSEEFNEPDFYGWVDCSGNIYDHFEKSIQGDLSYVVGWRELKS